MKMLKLSAMPLITNRSWMQKNFIFTTVRKFFLSVQYFYRDNVILQIRADLYRNEKKFVKGRYEKSQAEYCVGERLRYFWNLKILRQNRIFRFLFIDLSHPDVSFSLIVFKVVEFNINLSDIKSKKKTIF